MVFLLLSWVWKDSADGLDGLCSNASQIYTVVVSILFKSFKLIVTSGSQYIGTNGHIQVPPACIQT